MQEPTEAGRRLLLAHWVTDLPHLTTRWDHDEALAIAVERGEATGVKHGVTLCNIMRLRSDGSGGKNLGSIWVVRPTEPLPTMEFLVGVEEGESNDGQ